MRIQLVRSGGFGNITQKVEVDTDALDKPLAVKLERLVSRIDLQKIKAAFDNMRQRVRDGFCYSLSVDGHKPIKFPQGSCAQLVNLIDEVVQQNPMTTA